MPLFVTGMLVVLLIGSYSFAFDRRKERELKNRLRKYAKENPKAFRKLVADIEKEL